VNVEHERALLMRNHAPVTIPWRTHRLLLRAVLFFLTLLGVAAFYWLLDEYDVARPGVITGVLSIAAAELLIRVRRWWWTGVEEALWLASTFALVSELPESGTPEAMLVLALAAAIPGWRMRNPLFGLLAAGFVVQWFEKRFDLGVVSALLMAAIAVAALLRTWRRPSTEWLGIALAIGLPVVGRAVAGEQWRTVTIILFGAFGAATLLLAIRKRHHALFLSGGVAFAIAAVDLGEKMPLANEAKLAVAGGLLLVGSWLVARRLHGRTTGIVATPAQLTSFDDQLQVAATLSLPQQNFGQTMESGGRFGGAGATGDY
jgi:hypothetical protein